tara:strand:- start:712 stop:3327 length:2616 start_codon:yes stop_codon:yes gene_type:complete
MVMKPDENPLLPTAKLLVVVGADASIRLLQHRLVPTHALNIVDLELIAAFSAGRICTVKEGLDSYLDSAGLNDLERERCRKLAKKLRRQKRIEKQSEHVNVNKSVTAEAGTFSAVIPDGALALLTPCAFRPRDGKFETITHDGTPLPSITVVQLHALSQLSEHHVLQDAIAAHRAALGDQALSEEQFRDLLVPFVARNFVIPHVDRSQVTLAELSGTILSGDSSEISRELFRRNAETQDAAECERELSTGRRRPKVIPVAFDMCPPAGLGAVVAYAKIYEEGALEEFYNFRTDWIWDPDRLQSFAAEPAVYLFTNYLWSHGECIETSAKIKALSPNSITIHGGPDTPKYEGDQRRYFAENPHVDVTIQGEGEISCAEVLSKLRQVIGDPQPDLSILDGISGVTYRTPDGIARNAKQGRISDLDQLPSAYLTGLFDNYMGLDDLFIILETNRGCPYGCTFCDWGSATASKIRKFDMERVTAELEWAAAAKATAVSIADANFGVFSRDVDIAQKAAQLKTDTGYPRGLGGNYAKNSVKYLRKIIDVLAEGGILSLGTLSLQSMDENTLDVINRANIKTEKYDALAVEMRNSGLPLTVELMMGLPGSTLTSFREDLQQCIDRELSARINMTTLLVNSPMNEPSYLEEHKIKTSVPIAPGNLAMLASTATYTENDLTNMRRVADSYLLFENYGVLRTISRFVRQETSFDEMGFYEKLLVDTFDMQDHHKWPMLHVLSNFASSLMAPPVSWYLVTEELGRYLQEELGLEDTSALRSVLAAQLACIPAHDRVHPETVQLECDVVAWHSAILAEKASGNRRGWTDTTPRLGTYETGSLTVDDPFHITSAALGINRELNAFGVDWELDSPLHRARVDLA